MSVTLFVLAFAATSIRETQCNYAKIVQSHSVIVRAGHRDRSKGIKRLSGGTVVYICDDYRNDDLSNRWVQVSFRDRSYPCRGTVTGLLEHLAPTCRAGWVREHYVNVISG